MMNTRRMLVALALAVMAFAAQRPALAQSREESKLLSATRVLEELRAQRDQAIPERLLQRAYGVAVIPSVRKVAFVLGGRGGRGVLTVRDSRGRFSNPVFITLAGGSVGWQIGAQETDVVLVFTTRRGIEGIADGKLTLGAGASAAAGPVGRQAEVAAGVNAEVFSYSRARGLFAGVALGLLLGCLCGIGGLASMPASAQANAECVTEPVLSPVLAVPPEFNCVEPPVVRQPIIEEPLDICDFYGFCGSAVASVP